MIRMVSPKPWKRYLVIPCAAFAAAALHPATGWAESPMQARAAQSTLTDAQKQQLFEVRRRWELSNIDQQKALLAAKQRCIQSANTIDAFRVCKQEQRQGKRELFREARAAMTAERQRLGLPPRRERRRFQKQGRSNWNGPEFS
jgi:hypothetical protein